MPFSSPPTNVTMDSLPKSLVKSKKFLSDEHFQLCVQLCELGQEHLFDGLDAMPPSTRRAIAEQLDSLDEDYTDGGLVGYIENARVLLANSKKGVNPLEGWEPEVPAGKLFTLGSSDFKETELVGMSELGSVGFVLVAGGLGERLGYNGIKVKLPTELTTETRYLQHYIEYILAVQEKFAPKGRLLPLCIMTSKDTNDPTVQLLEANHYFGMEKKQVYFVQQGQGVPALLDNEAKFAFKGGKIITKPHGHGDIHALLHKHGVATDWAQEGIKWMSMFQDTNALAFFTLPLMLGVSTKMNLIMNSLTVPRKAKQAIGAITKLKWKETGETRTINVEYNQLDPLLRANGYDDGDVDNPDTEFSPFPGNINQLLFKLDDYCDALKKSRGVMPEFVNPKYADASKTEFKKPTRLECMMQDFPTVLDSFSATRVGFTSVSADLCFSPVKNSAADGVALQSRGTAPGVAATGEADQYAVFRNIMRSIGCNIEDAPLEKYLGIEVTPGPAIVVKPNFAIAPEEFKARFPTPENVRVSARSTLVIRGSNIAIYSLDLDGALIIDVPDDRTVAIEGLVVTNAGWVRVPADEKDTEVIRMRGYKIERKETLQIKSQVDVEKAIAEQEASDHVATSGVAALGCGCLS